MSAPDFLLAAMADSDLERLAERLRRLVRALDSCWSPSGRRTREAYQAQLDAVVGEIERRKLP